jgi:tRNA 2-selenouridine synthase
MENESRVIGTVHQPQELFDALREAPVWAVDRTEEERVDELCRVYGNADREALKAAFVRIQEKLGGLKMQEAIHALDSGDLRSAATIGLIYYDKLYRHTQERYVRDHYVHVECAGMDFTEAAAAVLAAAEA